MTEEEKIKLARECASGHYKAKGYDLVARREAARAQSRFMNASLWAYRSNSCRSGIRMTFRSWRPFTSTMAGIY